MIYWGDLHSHCNMSYGYGSLTRAYTVARQQLDFCSVTGHALWPDMPSDRNRYAYIIAFHSEGFAKLAANWGEFCRITADAHTPGSFVAFPSYEWHSIEHGDYNVYLPTEGGRIVDGAAPADLAANLGDALLLPHHIGYGPGHRGINWRSFDGSRSPAVEIYSGHGGSEREGAPFPMYHTMGPRCHEGLASTGLREGHRFAFTAGTDHHAGYPGSYGNGRTAIIADKLTQDSLWTALRNRRCYAVTGDKILIDLRLADAEMGDVIRKPLRATVECRVVGEDVLDRVDLIRNDRIIRRFTRADGWPPAASPGTTERYKIRVEWGWGPKDNRVAWNGEVRLSDGTIHRVEPYFRGDEVLAPSPETDGTIDEDRIPHELLGWDDHHAEWRSETGGNSMPTVAGTSSLVLELDATPSASLEFLVNGVRFSHAISELVGGSRSTLMRGWLSEAILVHRAVPESLYSLDFQLDAPPPQSDGTPAYYYVRVAQENEQWAWSSPIWVEV